MGIIRNGTMKYGEKRLRVKVFGREENGKFVPYETWINETDLVNVGILKVSGDYECVEEVDSE